VKLRAEARAFALDSTVRTVGVHEGVANRDHAAATTARADDAVGREALCKYILCPPIAQENIRLVADDLGHLELKRPARLVSLCELFPSLRWLG
jgi:hypothetical protein